LGSTAFLGEKINQIKYLEPILEEEIGAKLVPNEALG
jgi:hypothetical protein